MNQKQKSITPTKTSPEQNFLVRPLRYRCINFLTCAALLAAQFTLLPNSARADITVIGKEIGGNVVLSYSGSVDLAGFNFVAPSGNPGALIIPGGGVFAAGPNPGSAYYTFTGSAFSYGAGVAFATSTDPGQNFSINPSGGTLNVDVGYTTGAPISGALNFNGATFTSLSIQKGTYSIQLTPGFNFKLIFGSADEETSAQTSGLAMANAQGQMLMSAGAAVTNDVNGFLFNLRAGDGEEAASEEGGIAASMDYGVVVGEGDGPENARNPIAKKVLRSRQWEAFTTVGYGNVKLNAVGGQAGVQVDSWAPSVGISRHLSRGLAVGFAVSFLTSDQGYTAGLGSLHLEGPALSAYVSFARKNFWSSLLYSFGVYELDSTRNPGFGFPQAFGSTRTYTNAVQYNTGWNFRFQNNTLVTGPFAGIDYLHGSVDSYAETGGGAAALAYGEQSYESLVTRVGWTTSKKIQTGWALITPQVRLSYERQNVKNNGTSVNLINAPFTAAGGNQTPGQDYMVAGAGVNFQFNDQVSLMLSYQGQFFRQDMQAHFGQVRIGYKF